MLLLELHKLELKSHFQHLHVCNNSCANYFQGFKWFTAEEITVSVLTITIYHDFMILSMVNVCLRMFRSSFYNYFVQISLLSDF